MREENLTFVPKCHATEDIDFTDKQRGAIALSGLTAPTQSEDWFGDDQTAADWCDNLKYADLPEALGGVCPDPCTTLPHQDPFVLNQSICEWHQDYFDDPEDFLGSLFYGQWPFGQCGKRDKTRHRPDPVHCSAEEKIISEYKYHNSWVTALFAFILLFLWVNALFGAWAALSKPLDPNRGKFMALIVLVGFIISAVLIWFVGWWIGVSEYDN